MERNGNWQHENGREGVCKSPFPVVSVVRRKKTCMKIAYLFLLENATWVSRSRPFMLVWPVWSRFRRYCHILPCGAVVISYLVDYLQQWQHTCYCAPCFRFCYLGSMQECCVLWTTFNLQSDLLILPQITASMLSLLGFIWHHCIHVWL